MRWLLVMVTLVATAALAQPADVTALVNESKSLVAAKKYDEAFRVLSRAFDAAPSVEIAGVLIQIYPATTGATAAGAARLVDSWILGTSKDLGGACTQPGLAAFRARTLPIVIRKAEETDLALIEARTQLEALKSETRIRVSALEDRVRESNSEVARVTKEKESLTAEKEDLKMKAQMKELKTQQLLRELKQLQPNRKYDFE